MNLSDADLKQLNPAWVRDLTPACKDKLLVTLIEDLREARERLAANSQNSSRPPRTDAPWISAPAAQSETQTSNAPADPKTAAAKAQTDAQALADNDQTDTAAPLDSPAQATDVPPSDKRKVGHQKGTQGHGRVLKLPVSTTHNHMASHCAVCGEPLLAQSFRPQSGHYVLDLNVSAHAGLAGIIVTHEKHLYGQTACAGCGHLNHTQPASCPDDPSWKKLPINERGLVGPTLASLIVCMAQRMRLSRRARSAMAHAPSRAQGSLGCLPV